MVGILKAVESRVLRVSSISDSSFALCKRYFAVSIAFRISCEKYKNIPFRLYLKFIFEFVPLCTRVLLLNLKLPSPKLALFGFK